MALQPIAFSDGSSTDILTKNTGLAYDESLNSAAIAHDSCTIGTGANRCLVHGFDNNVGAGADNVFISGSQNDVDSSHCGTLGTAGSTIGAGSETCAVIGGSGHAVNAGCGESVLIGANNTAAALTTIAIGGSMTVSGARSVGISTHVNPSTLSTASSIGLYSHVGTIISDVESIQPVSGALLTLHSTTQGLRIPVLTTGQMGAMPTPTAGQIIYNSSVGEMHRYDGTAWTPLQAQYRTSVSSTISGIWAAAQNITYTLFRAGNLVTLCWTTARATANTASFISSVAAIIPSAFRPAVDYVGPYLCNNSNVNQVGTVTVNTAGTITWRAAGSANFVGSNDSGVFAWSVSYTTAT